MTVENGLLQTCDAAREAGVTTAAIFRAVKDGRLRVAAKTARGTRLYRLEDVREYRARSARAKGAAT